MCVWGGGMNEGIDQSKCMINAESRKNPVF